MNIYKHISRSLRFPLKGVRGSCLLPLVFCLLASCGKDRTYEYEERTVGCHQLQDLMVEWYLWGDSIKDLDWQQYFAKPTDFISKLTAQSKANDKWSYCLMDTVETDPLPCGYFNRIDSYGMDVVLMTDPTGETSKQYARVVTVYADSPAECCGLQRNDFIGVVDGNKMASTVIKNLVSGRSMTLVVSRLGVDSAGETFYWTGTDTIAMDKSERVEVPAVMVSRLFDGTVGYVMLSDLSDTERIVSALTRLRTSTLTDCIVDLRLCNRGTIDCVWEVAKLLAQGEGTFLQTIWNDAKATNNRSYTVKGTANFTVYFITSGYTQGAAEWLIHGLRGMSPDGVYVVGTKTAGQNVMLKAIPSDYQFTIYPAVAYVADKDGSYDYAGGISPDEVIDEMQYVALYPYGSPYEVLIHHILSLL